MSFGNAATPGASFWDRKWPQIARDPRGFRICEYLRHLRPEFAVPL
jgi:hypothetical protein